MKTTVEISDDLLKRSQRLAKLRGTTLRAIVEEGLQLALKAHRQRRAEKFEFPSFGKSGLTDEFRDASWSKKRDMIYGTTTSDNE
ncbi:MAG TPA: type II toxin-antitoxin system VapB family antitoxin [Gammaproteobacteria bacterium]|nr:type II toxin-antitoxin system VapB family antitoxin [Gammaproteobacteria bacterium]